MNEDALLRLMQEQKARELYNVPPNLRTPEDRAWLNGPIGPSEPIRTPLYKNMKEADATLARLIQILKQNNY